MKKNYIKYSNTTNITIDAILSIGITIYILIHVIKNIKEVMEVFLEKSPKEYNDKVIKELLINKYIKEIHHIHLWTLDGMNNYITLHAVIKKDITDDEIYDIKKEIKEKLKNINIKHATVEIELEDETCENPKCQIKYKDVKHNH